MTDARGARASWMTAAFVAPAGAALIAATTGWALAHNPTAAPSAVTTPVKPVVTPAPVDLQLVALSRRIAAQQQRVASLQRLIAAVTAQTRSLQVAPATVVAAVAPSRGYWAPRSGSSSAVQAVAPVRAAQAPPRAAAQRPAPAAAQQPAPAAAAPQAAPAPVAAPAPPVQATTGASGARA